MIILDVPVVFITFKRPDYTYQVFDSIKRNTPRKLYLVSDAGRESNPGEIQIVLDIRAHLEEMIDWECEVIKIYAKSNMGCARRIATALDEVFKKEDRAIILEDDCVPNESFFRFCQDMLERYSDDSRIMSISGSTEIKYIPSTDKDYYFSKIFGCWGWATWKRAWNLFDYNMPDHENRRNEQIFRRTLFASDAYTILMAKFDDLASSDNKFSWAYIFYYYSILNDGYHIYPKYNLVENIGFSSDSTHTDRCPSYYYGERREMVFPLRYRDEVVWEREYDALSFKLTQRIGLINRIKYIISKIFKG